MVTPSTQIPALTNFFNKKKQDDANYQSFLDSSNNLIDNGATDVLRPDFQIHDSTNKSRNKIIDGMMTLFNARKSQILSRQNQPGIYQTRLDY